VIGSGTIRRTEGRLADGREIYFYDRPDRPDRDIADPRDLTAPTITSDMRYDRLLDEWVVVASLRQQRTNLPSPADCPLCPSRGGQWTEIPQADYDAVVIANRFPSLVTAPVSSASLDLSLGVDEAGGAPLVRPNAGRCEVVSFTSQHDVSFRDLSPAQARLVVEVWADRTRELAGWPNVEQVFCFENRGDEIGATIRHPHGQIYAYPYVTPRTRQMLNAARRHRDRHGGNLFADLLTMELADGRRVVRRGEHWTAFVPVAARWPIEVHLLPDRQVAELGELTDAERDDFVDVYLDLLGRLDRLYDRPLPYISGWHQAPVRSGRDLAYTHLQVFSMQRSADRWKYLAGSESAMGAFVNDVRPEDLAQRLRDLA
jgi:UDPglucose--hexose-1-phosphate uridylyltransferase